MKARITGSRVDRVWHCPASAVLPQIIPDQEVHEPARRRGKDVHRFLERARLPGEDRDVSREVAIANAPEELRPLLEAIDLADLPVDLATEVSFAWNWKNWTARELGRNLDRAYDSPSVQPPLDWDSEIPATLDIEGVASGASRTRGFVSDYKTGHGKLPPPDRFGQTLLGALCVREIYGCDDCIVELITIHEDGGHHRVRRLLSEWDMDLFAEQLSTSMEEVEALEAQYARTGQVSAREGPWCRYCDAYKSCPAKVALVRSIPAELMALGVKPDPETGALVLTPGVISVRNAAAAWMTLERVKDVVNRAFDELRGIAWHEDIPLPDGRVVQRVVTERRHANGKIAAELLEKRFGRAERDRRVQPSVTLSELKAAVAAHLPKGQKLETSKKTGAFDKFLEELADLGGLEVKETETVKAQAPKAR